MSWLNPRRPKKPHPWPPRDRRVNRRGFYVGPQPARGDIFKALYARDVATCFPREEKLRGMVGELFHMPLPQTSEELRAAGFSFIGRP